MKRYSTNNFIKAKELRIIDAEGKNLGIFSLGEALKMAYDQDLDLVEINPATEPPVAKICDFGKFLYQQKKEDNKNRVKQRKDELKKVRLTFQIGQHDQDVRLRQTEKFLEEGHKVQVDLFMRGREKGRKDLAEEKLKEFLATITGEIKMVSPIQKSPRSVFVVISR